jgi:Flp pilus assembly pilin Flp
MSHDPDHAVDRSPSERPELAERGASLVEYALLVALIALVCIGAVSYLGTTTSDDFSTNAESLFDG